MTNMIICDHCDKPMQRALMGDTYIPQQVLVHFADNDLPLKFFYFECPSGFGRGWYIPPMKGFPELVVKRAYQEPPKRKHRVLLALVTFTEAAIKVFVNAVFPSPKPRYAHEAKYYRSVESGQWVKVWVPKY